MFQFPCYVEEVKTIKDGGLRIKLETQELAPAEKALVFGLNGLMWACFSDTTIRPEDVEVKEVRVDGDKSPSARQRAILRVYWEQNQEKKMLPPWEAYYLLKMDEIAEYLKSKLD
jgi:hypothetical protein